MEKEIKKLVDEIILCNDKNFEKLKKLVKGFFKGKTQQDLEKIGKSNLQSFVTLYSILFNKEFAASVSFASPEVDKSNLTEVERAFLDRAFHKEKPVKYIWREIGGKIKEEKLKNLTGILANELAGSKNEQALLAFVGWILINNMLEGDSLFETIFGENKTNDFRFELAFDSSEGYVRANLFLIGNKKHKKLIEEGIDIFK